MKSTTLKRALFAAALSCTFAGFAGNSFAQEQIAPAREVSVSNSYLNNLFMHQWVRLDAADRLTGSVVGLEPGSKVSMGGLPVYLIADDVVVHTTRTNVDGTFAISGVKPGAYALVVRDASSIGAFALHVLTAEAGKHLPSDVEVRVITPALDATKIIRQQSVPGAMASYPEMVNTDPLAGSRVFSSSPVILMNNGLLAGKVSTPGKPQDLSTIVVYVLKDGREVARASATAAGDFTVAGLKPGVYGIIAAGEAGFAATSFELAAPAGLASSRDKLIALVQDLNVLSVELMPPTAANVVEETVIVEDVVTNDPPFAPFGGGMPIGGGGSFGGGGGGGGMGGVGWGGIAGIAGLATVAAIIAADDDPQPVSPVVSQP
ncbi:MAG: hypothetical protein MUC83_11760 [Pirellula sp.]|jgi:hypothetical protein|nr:hypothetical protein [Pirellula sp.]